MKKFAYLTLALSFCFLFAFSACSGNLLEETKKHISDERDNYFYGESNNFYVAFSSGVRESPYVLDGKANKTVEFGVLTIVTKKRQTTQSLTYKISVDNENFEGNFEQSPFDDSYAADISTKVCDDATILVTISDGGQTDTATLDCLSKKFNINSQKALELALNEIQNEFFASSKQNYEVHIKIVADISNIISDKFWLVMFLCEDGKSLSVLINPMTGECETKKV